ncbi:MAG: SAM-dependent methyltransferase, partial [Pyrobaculum sp.]
MAIGKVVFIGAGPGDPELITVKGMRYLQQAEVVVYAGSLVNSELLKWARPDAEVYNSATMTTEEIVDIL